MSKAASKNRWLALTDVERKEKLEREAALRTAWTTSVFAENARVRDVASARSTPRVPAPMPFHPRGAVGEARLCVELPLEAQLHLPCEGGG